MISKKQRANSTKEDLLLKAIQYQAASPSQSISPRILSQQNSPRRHDELLKVQAFNKSMKFDSINNCEKNDGELDKNNENNSTSVNSELLKRQQKHVTGSSSDFEAQQENPYDQKKRAGEMGPQEAPNSMTVLYCLCLVNLIANSAYSSIAPFYPNEAVGKGVPTSMLGIVISAYSISMAIFSPLFANLLNTYGPKRVLIIGCLCEAVAMIVFGLFDFIEGPAAYATCSFCCRFLEGFGFGCLNSSSSKIVMMVFPETKLARMNGILQSFTGLGMLMGPIMGSLLYNLGGFQLPFYSVGILLLVLAAINYYTVPENLGQQYGYMSQNDQVKQMKEIVSSSKDGIPMQDVSKQPLIGESAYDYEITNIPVEKNPKTSLSPEQSMQRQLSDESQQAFDKQAISERKARYEELQKQFTFWNVLRHFNISTIALSVSLSLMCLTFKEPIFAIILQNKDLNVTQIGLVFSIDTISYSLTSMCLNFVKEERNGMKYGLIQFAGLLLFGMCMLMSGPAPFFNDKLWILILGVMLGGIGGAFVNNNSVPAMLHTELQEYHKVSGEEMPQELKQRLQSSVASIHTGAFGIGAILGPILASLMIQFMSYRSAFMYVGFVVFVCSTPHFFSQVLHRRKPNPLYINNSQPI